MICIYHSRDLDGWMSAAIVKLKFGPDVELLGWDYGDPLPDLSFKEVIMVDLSFPKDIMEANSNRLTWIDHHISAIKNISEEIMGKRDPEFAACELTWQYFFPNKPMPEIVRLLGRYDCFGHKGTEEELKVLEFQYGARANFFDPETCYQALTHWDTNQEHVVQIAGYNIYNYLCAEATQIYARRFTIKINEYYFAAVNTERFNPVNFGINYHNDRANDFSLKLIHSSNYYYDGFACFWYNKGTWTFSLYNDNGQVDCSKICETFGGGGHKGAAGFTVYDIEKFLKALTI